VIPVLNLRRRLDLPEGEFTKHSRIMIVESGVKVLGLLVDGVSQVMRLPVAAVDTPPGDVDQGRAFVRGIGKIDSRLIMIMDLERVLAKETYKGAGVVTA
jgi:purine-binding chemotaxis protein CheW